MPKEELPDAPGIPELLRALRRDLDEGQRMLRVSGDAPMLRLQSAEIEVAVQLARSADTNVGLTIKVLDVIGLGGERTKTKGAQSAHTIKLVLEPIDPDSMDMAGDEEDDSSTGDRGGD